MNTCDLYSEEGKCTKWRKNSKCEPSTTEWFVEDYPNAREYIPVNQMCRKCSIFGNDFIGLTEEDITRLKAGEVIHISGEYGIFIGFIEDGGKKK